MRTHVLLLAPGPNLEDWGQIAELALAAALSAAIGLEREIRQKSAGLRTHTLVGVGAALFMLISKYGFTDVVIPGQVILDPSRVAAQIVTGIGFLGAGLIFVRQDAVRGLTTAAAIWVTAAIGAASGAGLPILATATAGVYFVIALGFPPLVRKLPRSTSAISIIRVSYPDGRGVLRDILQLVTGRGFAVGGVSTQTIGGSVGTHEGVGDIGGQRTVEVTLQVSGRGQVHELAAALSEIPQVRAVVADDVNVIRE